MEPHLRTICLVHPSRAEGRKRTEKTFGCGRLPGQASVPSAIGAPHGPPERDGTSSSCCRSRSLTRLSTPDHSNLMKLPLMKTFYLAAVLALANLRAVNAADSRQCV